VRGRLRGTWLAAGAAVLVAAAAVLVAFLVSRPSSSPPAPHPTRTATLPRSAGPVTPAQGAYFGAWVSPTVYAAGKYTQRDRVLAVDSLQKTIKRRLDIVHIYLTQNGQFPTSSDLAFVNQGSTLLVSWALNNSRAVAKGKYDVSIIERAREIKKIGKPVFLEWRWEMDRPNLKAQVGTPAEYIAAWKHIREVFAQQGVTNVAWVWCPTSKGFTKGTAGAYYPGDSEVDWICADAYPPAGPLSPFATVAGPFLRWAAHHPSKPVMIGEYGVPGVYSPAERAQWLRAAGRTVAANRQIKALVYFDGPGAGQSTDVLSGGPLQAFAGIAGDSYFNPLGVGLTSAAGSGA
jgi:Glycosyl hydrolase family 26